MTDVVISLAHLRRSRDPDEMAIARLLRERVFEPEMVEAMTDAYERARATLGLTSRTDQMTILLARTVITVVESGVRDAERIYQLTLQNLGCAEASARAHAASGQTARVAP